MKKKLFKAASAAMALLLAYYLLDPAKILSSISDIGLSTMLIGSGLLIAASFVAGVRWIMFCTGTGITDICFWKKIRLNYAASVVGMVLPVYGGSDAFRAMAVSVTRKDSGWKAAMSIGASRANGFIIAVSTMCITGAMLDIPTAWRIGVMVFGVMVLVLVVMFPLILRRLPDKYKSLKEIPFQSPQFRSTWRKAFILSIAFQGLLISSRAFVGWEIGVELSWVEHAFISSALFVASPFLPSFGFIGLGTATFVAFAAARGANPEAATALSVAWYGCWVLATVPGLFFYRELKGSEILSAMKDKVVSIRNGRKKEAIA